jgi:hypothetical protein
MDSNGADTGLKRKVVASSLFVLFGAALSAGVYFHVDISALISPAIEDIESLDCAESAGWPKQLYYFYRQMTPEREVAAARKISVKVTSCLITGWNGFSELVSIMGRNPGLEAFILRHINDAGGIGRCRELSSLFEEKCPNGLSAICSRYRLAMNTCGYDFKPLQE